MADFISTTVTVTMDSDSITLNWALETFAPDHSVVIYRSPVPVFEAAEDIAEISATAVGSYADTTAVAGVEYTYWLVQADNDVEVAITSGYAARLVSEPVRPVAPEEPQNPIDPERPSQPTQALLFLPNLQR
jgi:hypothetical protein